MKRALKRARLGYHPGFLIGVVLTGITKPIVEASARLSRRPQQALACREGVVVGVQLGRGERRESVHQPQPATSKQGQAVLQKQGGGEAMMEGDGMVDRMAQNRLGEPVVVRCPFPDVVHPVGLNRHYRGTLTSSCHPWWRHLMKREFAFVTQRSG